MRKFRLAVLFIVTVLVFSPLANGDAVKYRNKSKGFSIGFPKDWKQEESAKGSTVVFAESPSEGDEDPYRENTSITVEPVAEGTTLVDYHNKLRADIRKVAAESKLLAKGPITVNGMKMRWFLATFKVEGSDLASHRGSTGPRIAPRRVSRRPLHRHRRRPERRNADRTVRPGQS